MRSMYIDPMIDPECVHVNEVNVCIDSMIDQESVHDVNV